MNNFDGFNERTNYIHNANDINKNNNMSHNFDNSFAQMRVAENKPDVETTNHDQVIVPEEARGNKENFILRNNNMMNANVKPTQNNPVSNALQRNMFKR